MNHCEHAQSVIVCKDKNTLIKRKRFKFCKDPMRCCIDCPLLATCKFVCPELGEDEDDE